jgi:hypothetical protein
MMDFDVAGGSARFAVPAPSGEIHFSLDLPPLGVDVLVV